MSAVNSHSDVSKLYYVATASDKYLTVRTAFNPLSRKMECQITDEVVGVPPVGMPEMSKKVFAMVKNGKISGRQNLESK